MKPEEEEEIKRGRGNERNTVKEEMIERILEIKAKTGGGGGDICREERCER